jgi:hypothetical protein
MRRSDSNSRRPNDRVHPAAVAANLRGTVAQAPRSIRPDLRTRRPSQQRSTATTARSNTFGSVQMRAGQRKQGFMRLLRGIRDEAAMGSNRAGIVQVS